MKWPRALKFPGRGKYLSTVGLEMKQGKGKAVRNIKNDRGVVKKWGGWDIISLKKKKRDYE